MRRLGNIALVVSLMLLTLAGRAGAAGPLVVHSGQTIPVTAVYWVGTPGCVSRLNKIVGTDLLSGGENLTLSLQPQTVRTYQCGNDVPGAWVFATAKPVSAETDVQLKFIVNYDTNDGPKVSAHLFTVKILP